MSRLLLVLLLSGCASQLDLYEGDISVTLLEIDAKASIPVLGNSVEADGCSLIIRGVDDVAALDKISMKTPTCSYGK